MSILLAAVAISGGSLLQALVWIVVGALIYWLCKWAIAEIAPPEPFAKILHVALVLLVLVICINGVLLLFGSPFIRIG